MQNLKFINERNDAALRVPRPFSFDPLLIKYCTCKFHLKNSMMKNFNKHIEIFIKSYYDNTELLNNAQSKSTK